MKWVKLWVLVLGLGWGLVCWGQPSGSVDPGEGYFQRGQFELAVRVWETNRSSLSVGQLLGLATAYQQLGRSWEALRVLKDVLNKNLQSSERAQVLMQLSELYLGMRVIDRELLAEVRKLPGLCSESQFLLSEGNRERDHADILIEEAEKCLSDSDTLLAKNIEKSGLRLQANLFNSKGNLLVAKAERKKLEPKYKEALAVYHEGEGLSKEASSGVLAQKEQAKQEAEKALKAYDKTLMEAYEKALTEAYEKGEQLANNAGDKLLAAKIAVNIVQVLTEQQKCTEAETKFNKVLPQLKSLPDSHDKAFTLIGLAAQFTPLFTSLLQSSPNVGEKKRCSLTDQKDNPRWSAFNEALGVAKSQGDKTAMAYAEGYLAQLYIEQKRYDEAKQLTNQAIFHTQESADSADLLSAPAQLFRWEWQLGKLFDLQKDSEKAISVYRQAAKHLEITKQRCGGVSRAFLREGEDFYYEYVELLHRQPVANNGYLEELTCVIDSFKTTQLQNYFYSGCPYDIIDNTRRLRGSDNRGIMTCFDKKYSTPTAAALSYSSVATPLSYPFVFANSVAKNITSLLGVSHSIMPQFGSISLSMGLRKQRELGQSNTQESPKREFSFDRAFFDKNPRTAVLYLFMFDRNPSYKDVGLELLTAGSPTPIPICLLPLPDGSCDYFNQMKTNVEELQKKVDAFRTAIESKGDLTGGKDLYQCLIAPFIPHLQGQDIDTLVLVPNSVLHTLPFAALWWDDNESSDGKKYLIEKYALVVAPDGANSIALKEAPFYDNILSGGLSEAIGEFKALLYTENELNAVIQSFTNKGKLGKLLMNRNFTVSNLEETLKNPYSVVHFSTHGVFDGKDTKSPYLLKYPEKETGNILSINRLGDVIRGHNVELLVLSACTSAIGNNGRDALGLVGAGITAGARSAVGTLWSVPNQTTSTLMKTFYEKLLPTEKSPSISKAQALQGAQRDLMGRAKYLREPYYWAAFILTGNWW